MLRVGCVSLLNAPVKALRRSQWLVPSNTDHWAIWCRSICNSLWVMGTISMHLFHCGSQKWNVVILEIERKKTPLSEIYIYIHLKTELFQCSRLLGWIKVITFSCSLHRQRAGLQSCLVPGALPVFRCTKANSISSNTWTQMFLLSIISPAGTDGMWCCQVFFGPY